MRLLIAGLVLLALGIGLTEYSRRNANEKANPTGEKSKAPAPTGAENLLDRIDGEVGESAATAEYAPPDNAEALSGFTPVLSGPFRCRELKGGAGFAVFVADRGGVSSLIRVTPGEPARVLLSRKNPITSVAVDGDTVVWAEKSLVLSMPADGSGGITARLRLTSALVTSLSAAQGAVVMTLMPLDGDPLSEEPSGSVAVLSKGGDFTLVVGLQIRPHEVLTDGKEAVWASGYPSGLGRASLDGSYSSRIADRADGPMAFDGTSVIHRFPETMGPEVRSVARAGGSMKTLVTGAVDWLAFGKGQLWHTSTGFNARLSATKPGEPSRDVLLLPGASAGVAVAGEAVVVLSTNEGSCSVLVHPAP